MDLQKLIDLVGEAERGRRKNVRLAHFIDLLKAVPEELPIKYDTGEFPGPPDSYRGYYSDLALAIEPTENEEAPTVKHLLGWMQEALGKTYQGYKGGDFVMDAQTPLWASNYGECNGTMITGISVDSGWAIIKTEQSK